MRRTILPLCILLGACAPAPTRDVPTRAANSAEIMPVAPRVFRAPNPLPPLRANADIARDFMSLAFQLESGRKLSTFTRFEGPIRVRVTGSPGPTLGGDLNRLLHRLRAEAGLDIALSRGGAAQITIEAVSRKQIRKHLPQAACFVVPNISSLSEYRTAKRRGLTSWSALRSRKKLAIFLPNDASPQEVRDCLHEELAQALGPLNDLYRLSDSVFNDDNIHTVLTGFDMLVLRAYYAPELRNGMSRGQVAARLPAILSRLNPQGDSLPSRPAPPTPRTWIDAIQTALGPGATPAARKAAAQRAVREAQGWPDHRRGFAHFALGRILQASDPSAARQHFETAHTIFARAPDSRLHSAFTAAQLAAYAVSAGRGEEALAIISPHLGSAERYENAALLATLMMLRAEALDLTGRSSEAQAVRLDSLGWARYGFGADWAVRAKLREITDLSPLKGSDG